MSKALYAWRQNWYSLPVVILLVSLDQLTKTVAAATLRSPHFYLNLLQLYYTENSGANFSVGANLPPTMRFWLFTVGFGLVVVGLQIYIMTHRHRTLTIIATSMVIAGGGSNVLDRIIHGGAVVDFISVGLGFFNLADLLVGSGLILLIFGNHNHSQS